MTEPTPSQTPEATPQEDENEAACVCGRRIFRPWFGSIQEPWRHWVEPMDHDATPREEHP